MDGRCCLSLASADVGVEAAASSASMASRAPEVTVEEGAEKDIRLASDDGLFVVAGVAAELADAPEFLEVAGGRTGFLEALGAAGG